MKRGLSALFAVIVAILVATPATAQEFTEGVRSAGMGEAFTATATGTSGIYHNPAGIARAAMYELDATFEYADTGSILNASVADSKTNPAVGAGVGYSYFFGRDLAEDISGHDIRLALGVPVVPDRISLGIGGRYLILDQGEVELMNGITLDAGAIFKVINGVHLGVVGKNLIEQCERELCKSVAPTVISGGFSFGSDVGLTVSGDIGFDITSEEDVSLQFNAGLEYIAVVVPLRVGFQRTDAVDQSLLTFGLGWRSRAAGFDVAYQLDLVDTESMYFLGSFSIYL